MHFDVQTFAGTGVGGASDGPVGEAQFNFPTAITVTANGAVYVSEALLNGLRKIEGGVVTTLADRTEGNTDGALSAALFRGPTGIVSDQAGNLYVADQGNHRVRKIDTTGNVTTIAGPNGPELFQGWADSFRNASLFSRPRAIAIDATDATLYVSEHHRIRRVPLRQLTGRKLATEVGTLAGIGIRGYADGPPTLAQFNEPLGIAVTQTGDIFVADTNNFRIRRVSPDGTVTTVAGDGVPADPGDKAQFVDAIPALGARFQFPSGLAIDSAGIVWVGDNKHVRMYSPLTGTVSTACSDTGPFSHQQPIEFDLAGGITVANGKIFVIDGNKIKVLTPHRDIEDMDT
jgi:DNA-binding beta-propeller fold protein YncE